MCRTVTKCRCDQSHWSEDTILEVSSLSGPITIKSAELEGYNTVTDSSDQVKDIVEVKISGGNENVSRNITIVLENLLKNYESSQTPTHGKGGHSSIITACKQLIMYLKKSTPS